MYFKLFKLHSRGKRSAVQSQTIYSEFPQLFYNSMGFPVKQWRNGKFSAF